MTRQLFQLDVAVFHKTIGGNYHKYINLKKIDACKVMDNIDDFPMLKGAVDWLSIVFPKVFHKCPYTVSFEILSLNEIMLNF
jgi:hypothetical protein